MLKKKQKQICTHRFFQILALKKAWLNLMRQLETHDPYPNPVFFDSLHWLKLLRLVKFAETLAGWNSYNDYTRDACICCIETLSLLFSLWSSSCKWNIWIGLNSVWCRIAIYFKYLYDKEKEKKKKSLFDY